MATNSENFAVNLSLNSKGFQKGLKDAGKDVDGFSKNIGDYGRIIQEQKDITIEFEKELRVLQTQLKNTSKGNLSQQTALKSGITNLKGAIGEQRIALKDLNNQQKKNNVTSKSTVNNLSRNYGAIQLLDQVTGGMASQFRAAEDATRLFNTQLKFTKTALIATGIGLFIVALGLVVAYWEEIVGFINQTEAKLKRQLKTQEQQATLSSARLKALKAENELLKLQGQNLDSNIQKQNKELTFQLALALSRKNSIQDQLDDAKKAKAAIKPEVIRGQLGGSTTVPINQNDLDAADDKIAGLDEALQNATTSAKNLQSAIIVLLTPEEETNPIKDPLKALTGLDASLIDLEISDIEVALNKLKFALADSTGYEETESILKQIFDDERRLIELQLAKKIKLADTDKTAIAIAINEAGTAQREAYAKNHEKLTALLNAQNSQVGEVTKTGSKKVVEELNEFAEAANSIIADKLVGAFSGIGQAIGNALVSGGNLIDSLGSTLLASIGGLVTQLGEAAIAVGVGMLAIQASFTSPFAAIAAGVALVAIGTAINSAKGSVGSIGSGGGASSSSGGGVSSSSGFTSSSSQVFQGRVVFEIAGSKLVGVLNNENRQNNRIGDGGLIRS
jgi:hypothetical protein